MSDRFKDKVVVVIGASAKGCIGWHCAKQFAAEGAHVIVAARNLAGVTELAEQIGGRAMRCDISRDEEVAAVAEAAGAWGGLDIAVNAAGAAVPSMFASFDQATLENAMAVNFYGNLYFVRHMATAMPRGGSIVLIASQAAIQVVPGNMLYGCAKAATITAAKYAAHEYASQNIRVNVLLPGLVNTPMIAPMLASPALRDAFLKEVPLKRIAEPDEVADAALWLSSSPSVTGTLVTIDGGMSLRRPPQLDELPADAFAGVG